MHGSVSRSRVRRLRGAAALAAERSRRSFTLPRVRKRSLLFVSFSVKVVGPSSALDVAQTLMSIFDLDECDGMPSIKWHSVAPDAEATPLELDSWRTTVSLNAPARCVPIPNSGRRATGALYRPAAGLLLRFRTESRYPSESSPAPGFRSRGWQLTQT